MKILFLADANSIHTQKWVESLTKHKIEIKLFSLINPNKDSFDFYKSKEIKTFSPNIKISRENFRRPTLQKIKYIKSIWFLKKIINDFQPDLIHAHYASSYGILGYLSRFKPLILSVWGSDLYYFPNQGIFNKMIMKQVINYSSKICSTSNAMKKVIESDYNRFDVNVVPFGIDINQFQPKTSSHSKFIVGTIKSIEDHNGIDCLIDAAKLVMDRNYNEINFLIVGDGTLKEKMQKKVFDLNLNNNVKFTGHVSHEKVIEYFHSLSVFIAMSTRESFGVSILEAAACGIPSITSNVGGLPEVNLNEKTGYTIKANDSQKLADLIIMYYKNNKKKEDMGLNARKNVEENFDWNKCVKKMVDIYNN